MCAPLHQLVGHGDKLRQATLSYAKLRQDHLPRFAINRMDADALTHNRVHTHTRALPTSYPILVPRFLAAHGAVHFESTPQASSRHRLDVASAERADRRAPPVREVGQHARLVDLVDALQSPDRLAGTEAIEAYRALGLDVFGKHSTSGR